MILESIGVIVMLLILVLFCSCMTYACTMIPGKLFTKRTVYEMRKTCPECGSLLYSNGQVYKCPRCRTTITFEENTTTKKLKPIALDVTDAELEEAFGEDDV